MTTDSERKILAPSTWPARWVGAAVVVLLAILAAELIVSIRRQSPAFDEGAHILGGYSYWTRSDFGINPEHPPLVKLLATLPLLTLHLQYPPPPPGFFKTTEFVGGRNFLFANNVDQIMTRARLAVSLLTLLAALLVFAAAYEMFGQAAALLALLLFVFEPTVIAHGSLVTTDMAMALFLFATAYGFYRYVKHPSTARLILTCVAAGLCLAGKHSGVLWVPILLLLAIGEVVLSHDSKLARDARLRHSLQLAGSLVVVGVVSLVILWAFYGFRYQFRPNDEAIVPQFAGYVEQIGRPMPEKVISSFARHHLLPEAYLYGLADVMIAPRYVTPYLFGKVYPHGLWFYPLAAFVIKSTLGFLLLLLTIPISIARFGLGARREFLFLSIPPAVYLLAALSSGFNHGNRYLVPLYPFLAILIAASAVRLARSHRAWFYAATALAAFHMVSSVHAFPDYLPYSNELWGGPKNTYRVLSDSNTDWGEELKSVKHYLDTRGIKDCWFDYISRAVETPEYYGIGCKPLPDSFAVIFGQLPEQIPSHIEGTVLVSDEEVSGGISGPGSLNPYGEFQKISPDEVIAGGILVYHGRFDLSLAAAKAHTLTASHLEGDGKLSEALAESKTAVALAPDDVQSQVEFGDVLVKLNRIDEAKQAYQRALTLAQTVHPEFQAPMVDYARWKMAGLAAR